MVLVLLVLVLRVLRMVRGRESLEGGRSDVYRLCTLGTGLCTALVGLLFPAHVVPIALDPRKLRSLGLYFLTLLEAETCSPPRSWAHNFLSWIFFLGVQARCYRIAKMDTETWKGLDLRYNKHEGNRTFFVA